jgi:hypothetical protein
LKIAFGQERIDVELKLRDIYAQKQTTQIEVHLQTPHIHSGFVYELKPDARAALVIKDFPLLASIALAEATCQFCCTKATRANLEPLLDLNENYLA